MRRGGAAKPAGGGAGTLPGEGAGNLPGGGVETLTCDNDYFRNNTLH